MVVPWAQVFHLAQCPMHFELFYGCTNYTDNKHDGIVKSLNNLSFRAKREIFLSNSLKT